MEFGRTEDLTPVLVTFVATVALATDVLRGRVYNALTLPAMLGGIGLQAVLYGGSGASAALQGIAAGFALFVWMYLLGFLGAGDVKLLMAFGALVGPSFAWDVALLSVALGGVLAAAQLAIRGKLPSFLSRMRDFAYTLMVRELERVPPKIDASLKMPFAIPMALAAVWRVWGGQGLPLAPPGGFL